MQADSIIAAL